MENQIRKKSTMIHKENEWEWKFIGSVLEVHQILLERVLLNLFLLPQFSCLILPLSKAPPPLFTHRNPFCALRHFRDVLFCKALQFLHNLAGCL